MLLRLVDQVDNSLVLDQGCSLDTVPSGRLAVAQSQGRLARYTPEALAPVRRMAAVAAPMQEMPEVYPLVAAQIFGALVPAHQRAAEPELAQEIAEALEMETSVEPGPV